MALLVFLFCVFIGWLILHFAFKIHWGLGLALILFGIIYTIIDIIIKIGG